MSDVGLTPARGEVAWFFASATAAMGLHAQGYEGGGGGGGGGGPVWDDARCDRAHEARLSVAHRQTVVRYGRVLDTMGRLEAGLVADLRDVYTPFGAARVSWQAYCCFAHEGRQLLALVLRTEGLRVAYERRMARAAAAAGVGVGVGGGGAGAGALLRFIADEVSGLDHKTIRPGHALPLGHPLEPALREAMRREVVAVTAYDAARVTRVRGEWDVREQYYAELRASLVGGVGGVEGAGVGGAGVGGAGVGAGAMGPGSHGRR